MSACIGEPVSWLRLERYALGELRGDEQRAVAEHLASCAVCRACSEQIARDVREPLPLIAAGSSGHVAPSGVRARPRKLAAAAPWAALVSASLAVWLMLRGPHVPPEAAPGMAVSTTKGGDIALMLVRSDRAGRLLEPTQFAPEDRFKLLLTCAPPLQGPVRVQIYQAGALYEPVPEQALPRCGNRVALSGAWQFDGQAALDVCVVFSEHVEASRLAQARSPEALAALGVPHVCAQLIPSD